MEESHISKILQGLPLAPRKTGQELNDGLSELAQWRHERDCVRCSGRNESWPCMDDPSYGLKTRRLSAGLPDNVSRTFENFEKRPGTEQPYEKSVAFAGNPEGWLVLLGGKGVGKSHLAQAITEDLLTRDVRVRYIQSGFLVQAWQSTFDERARQGLTFDEVFQSWCKLPVMLIDDLGAERATEWVIEKLTMLLDYRYNRRLPTVISTNRDDLDMAGHLGSRLADRLYDKGTGLTSVCVIDCTSYRTGHKW